MIRIALRQRLRRPAAGIAIIVLTVSGVAVNAALLRTVWQAIGAPLPFRNADTISIARETFQGNSLGISYRSLDWWRSSQTTLAVAAFAPAQAVAVESTGGTVQLWVTPVDSLYFACLGVSSLSGSLFWSGDEKQIVLSEDTWRTYFSASPDLVHRTIEVNGESYRVTGVAAGRDAYPVLGWHDGWIPMPEADRAKALESRTRRMGGIIRRPAGISEQQAAKQLESLQRSLAEQHPDTHQGYGAALEPIHAAVFGRYRPALVVLTLAAFAVVWIAVANCVGLLAAEAIDQARDVGIREALGASRAHLFWNRCADALVLAVPAALLSFPACSAVMAWVHSLAPEDLPRVAALGMPAAVAAMAAGAAFVLTFAVQLAAFYWTPAKSTASLQTRGSKGNPRAGRLERVTLGVQAAFTVILLAAAATMGYTVLALRAVHPGFEPRGLFAFRISLPAQRYNDYASKAAIYRRMIEELAAIPGVRSAGGAGSLPLSGALGSWMVFPADRPLPPPGQESFVLTRYVGPGYLESMGIPLLQGRHFTETEYWQRSRVALVNQAFARQFWPGEPAVGKRLKLRRDGEWLEVAGVIADTRQRSLRDAPEPELLQPYSIYREFPTLGANITFTVSMQGTGRLLETTVRETVRTVDPSLAPQALQTGDDLLLGHASAERLLAQLLGGYLLLALLVTLTGISASVRAALARRWREFGVRAAVGASCAQLAATYTRSVAWLVLPGIAAGMIGGAWSTLALERFTFALPAPGFAFVILSAAVLLIAAVVCGLPGYFRIRNLVPLEVLREE
jgi:predicted permease